MQDTIKFGIELPLNAYTNKIKRIKSKSFYDHNYYILEEYGDWIDFYGNNILYEVYHECENCYTYTFGRFENDKFIKAFGYTTSEDILEEIETINV